jgi:hypothetical protein
MDCWLYWSCMVLNDLFHIQELLGLYGGLMKWICLYVYMSEKPKTQLWWFYEMLALLEHIMFEMYLGKHKLKFGHWNEAPRPELLLLLCIFFFSSSSSRDSCQWSETSKSYHGEISFFLISVYMTKMKCGSPILVGHSFLKFCVVWLPVMWNF